MSRLGHTLKGRLPGQGRRPRYYETIGINWQSPQARGLMAWFPLFHPAGQPQVEMVRGARSTIFGAAPTHAADPRFGLIAMGGGNGIGSGTQLTYRFKHQAYFAPTNIVPNPWAYSYWFKTNSTSHTPDEYYMSHTFNGGTFPGTALSCDTSNQMALNTNGTALGDAGFKTTMNPFDTKWHHCLYVQIPVNSPNTFSAESAYFIDGGFDSTLHGTVEPGLDATPGDLFFLGDDQSDEPANGALMDWRLYRMPSWWTAANITTAPLAFAKHLYQEQTRWDLYQTRPMFDGLSKGTFSSAALTGTALASITKADIVTGAKTIIITLTGDTWILN